MFNQLKKVLTSLVLVLMLLIISACGSGGNNFTGGGGGGTPTTIPDNSPVYYLGANFSIASLEYANFTSDVSEPLLYNLAEINSEDKDSLIIIEDLRNAIKTNLEDKHTVVLGTATTTGEVVALGTFVVTIPTTITDIDNGSIGEADYIFTVKFLKTLTKWDGMNSTEIIPAGDVYEIENGEHLAWVAKVSIDYNNDFTGKTVRFANYVDMDNHTFTGIKSFAGRLEGNHKKIYGLNIDKSENNVGLISILDDGGVIDNLTIASGTIKGNENVGAFVGTTATGSTATIINVQNNATVNGNQNYVGGLVGYSNSTIDIDSSSNKGAVAGTGNYVGGLVGYSGSTLTIDSSSNTGDVNGTGDSVGGLVGWSHGKLTIDNTSNTGDVTGKSDIGGLVGRSSSIATLTNVLSYAGSVKSTINETSVGGIVGNVLANPFKANNVYWLHDGRTGIKDARGIVAGGTYTPNANTKALDKAKFNVDTNFQGWDFTDIWEMGAEYPTLIKP